MNSNNIGDKQLSSDKLGLTHKTLNIIYTSIAIIGLIVGAITPMYILYLLSGLSLILGIIIIAVFFRHRRSDSDKNDIFLIKRRFVITFLVFTLISWGLTSYFSYESGFEEAVYSGKTRIVLVLPCNNELGAAWEDGVRQILGLTYFFRDKPDYTSKYEFRIIDHKMTYDESLKNEIAGEIRKGTKIFISSMSKISEPLSKDFASIVKGLKPTGEPPILVCTIASSPNIITSKGDNIFRFYIRSKEEAVLLAKEGRNLNFKKAAYIVVDDNYGRGAIDEFRTVWESNSGKILDGTELNIKFETSEIEDALRKKAKTFQEADVIFLAHYGSGVDKVFSALDRLNIQTPVLATHTLTIPDWQKPIKKILQKRVSYSCKPHYFSRNPNHSEKEVYEDAISGFLYWTLDRIIYCLNETNGKTENFSEKWESTQYPRELEHIPQSNGDIAINLEFVEIKIDDENSGN